jgi:hypothetical protein
MNNKFFIEDGYLSFKMSDNVIKKYFYIECYETNFKSKILDRLNTDIEDVNIVENPFKKTISVTIRNKDFVKNVFYDDGTEKLFTFNLDNNCLMCNYR